MQITKMEDVDYGPPEKPFWRCEECGHEDHKKPMPKDSKKFYAAGKAPKCPKCKSEALTPQGF